MRLARSLAAVPFVRAASARGWYISARDLSVEHKAMSHNQCKREYGYRTAVQLHHKHAEAVEMLREKWQYPEADLVFTGPTFSEKATTRRLKA